MSVRDPLLTFWHRHLRDPAWWCGWFTLAAGAWLLLPFETLSPPWSVLGRLLPEWWWGLLLAVAGAWQLFAVVRQASQFLAQTTFCVGLIWTYVSLESFHVAPLALSTVIYPSVALMCGTAFFRIGSDARVAARRGQCQRV